MVFTMLTTLSAQNISCAPTTTGSRNEELDALGTVDMAIKGAKFRLWVADESGEQQRGLMHVSADRMADFEDGTRRGMIFVFDYEHELSFWMKDTIIPLDIAYLDTTGRVVSMHTMAPLDERPGQYPSGDPARFAIEVNAGVWDQLNLRSGDTIAVPNTLLKRAP